MGLLFGTDGIRGMANIYPMTAEIALKTGRAVAKYFNSDNSKKIVIGKDTRLSGDVFEAALIAGICSMGSDVYLAGVLPTPGISYLAASMTDVSAGIVISASHNPYHDNGIKIFKGDGYKLDDNMERELEDIILNVKHEELTDGIRNTGVVRFIDTAHEMYTDFLETSVSDFEDSFNGLKAVIDCSNGASSSIAKSFFKKAGMNITALFTQPDGININDNCGSEHTETMIRKVMETKSDIGLAFDGDADRLIAVDETGTVITGDQIIAICAKYAKETGTLLNNTVVTTVMSNMGLSKALKRLEINHIMAGVGDRYVMMDMKKNGAVIGGEDSGHMIFLNHHTTGDGMMSALKLLEVIKNTGQPLSELAQIMTIFPQKLVNVDVKSKPEIETIPEIVDIIKQAETKLNGKGRVLVRYSGTQPMLRVMVEAETIEDTDRYCNMIADVVKKTIG